MTDKATKTGHQIGRIVDLVTRILFYIACTALTAMVAITLFEIVMRYFFNQPTRWVSDSVGYLLAWMIMLGLPEVTLRRDHVSITILSDWMPWQTPYSRLLSGVSALTCFGAGYLSLTVTVTQFSRTLLTQGLVQIPKYWIGGAISGGFLLTGIVFLTLMFRPKTNIG